MKRRTLRVSSRRFVAGAEWELTPHGWRCINAAPVIKWMIGCSPRTAHARLMRERLTWEWLEASAIVSPVPAPADAQTGDNHESES